MEDIEEPVKEIIYNDFDELAMKTLKKGNTSLLYYVLKKGREVQLYKPNFIRNYI